MRFRAVSLIALATAVLSVGQVFGAPFRPKAAPADVAGFAFPTNTVISEAKIVSGEILTVGQNKIPLPEYCKVSGKINQRIGQGPKGSVEYYIGFELRLPSEWNGRFFFEGGGGSDGAIRPPVGSRQTGAVPALARGFATVATDAGHQGGDSQYGYDQTARLDYFYNAVLETAITAKSIIEDYYGTPAAYSYFVGGSNGGRQALAFAQRFPEMFDGIVAGAPALNLSKAAITQMWAIQVFAKIAPKGPSGEPLLNKALEQKDLDALAASIKRQYDARDGLEDGLIFDISAARGFVPDAIATGLSADKIAAIKKHFEGPKNTKGDALYSSWPYDSGVSDAGWRGWVLGTEKQAARNITLGVESLARSFMTPPSSSYSPEKALEWGLAYDFDLDPPKTVMSGAMLNNVNPRLAAFEKLGGKLILYHGMSDPVFSAYDTIAYYDKVIQENGGLKRTQDFARLFLFPGMGHVSGGPATDQFDSLTAIMDWVEKGRAPDRIIATGTVGGPYEKVSRPIFPYPAQTVYDGVGDPSQAASFKAKY